MGKRLSLCFKAQPYTRLEEFEDLELGKSGHFVRDDEVLRVELDFDMDLNTNPNQKTDLSRPV